jgi:ABC-type transporter Mla MlaB component
MMTNFGETPTGRGDPESPVDEPMGPVRLSVVGQAIWPSYRVTLVGSLDRWSLIAFEMQFDQSTCEQFELVILDLSGLTGLDQAGAEALARFRHHIELGGGSIHTEGAVTHHPGRSTPGPVPGGGAGLDGKQ